MKPEAILSTVHLIEYSEKYRSQLSNFYLPESQLEFTSLPLDKITSPEVNSSIIHVLIMSMNKPAGYFALENGEKVKKYSSNPKARVLTSFSIDSSFQGKGIATQGLKLLPAFVKEALQDVDEIVLGVNQRNVPARNLYLKTGFVDKNQIYNGPKGSQNILHLEVKKN